MTQNTFHLQLNFILLSRNVTSKQILNQDNEYQFEINSFHINFKLLLPPSFHCNLCNSPVDIFVDSNGYAIVLEYNLYHEMRQRLQEKAKTMPQ